MPIQDLPPELLEEIFVHCVPCGRRALYDQQGVNWIAPSQVCRQWRIVALACQRLWSCAIPFKKPFWTYTFLRRAGNAPLTFDIDLTRTERAICAPIVAAYADQMVELSISGNRGQVLATLAHFAQDTAPRLGVLAVEVQSQRRDNVAPCLPAIFQGYKKQQPLRLRTLELDFCYLPPTSHLYTEVTTFILRHPSPRWGDGQIHELLQTMPHLQSLCIDCVYDMPRRRFDQVLVLPQSLAHLRLVGDSRRITESQRRDFESFVEGFHFTAESWKVTCEVMNVGHMVVILAMLSDSVGSTPVILKLGPWHYRKRNCGNNDIEWLLVIRLGTMGPVRKSIILSVLHPPSDIDALLRPLNTIRHLHVVHLNTHGSVETKMDELGFRTGKMMFWWRDNFPHIQVWTIDALPPTFLLHNIIILRMLSVGVDAHFFDRDAVCDDNGHVIQIFADLRCIRLRHIDLSIPIWSFHHAQVEQRGALILPLILMIVWVCAKRQRLRISRSHIPRVIIKDCVGVDAGIVDALRGLTYVKWDEKGKAARTEYGDVHSSVLEGYIDMFGSDRSEIIHKLPTANMPSNGGSTSSF